MINLTRDRRNSKI